MRYLFIILFLLIAFPVSAHQVKTSGSISVMQHSDPNDDPYVAEPAVLHIVFTDTEGKFKATGCDCVVYVAPYSELDTIERTGSRFDFNTDEIAHSYNENYSFPFIFPRRDIYAIVVEGSPKEGAAFDPFRIVFDLRVDKVGEAASNNGEKESTREANDGVSPGLTIGIIILICIIAILIFRRRRNKI